MISRNPVAIVTGGGRRLGAHISLALARNGFDVAVNYHSSKAGASDVVNKIERLGRRGIAVRADVSSKAQVTRMMKKVHGEFGRLDLLVNNSAIFIGAPPTRIREEIWTKTIDINLTGVFHCTTAALPYLSKTKHSSIINISSLGGLQAWKKHIPYSVSKAGVIMLTKCFARALAPGIRVNSIAPGTIIMQGEEDPELQHVPAKSIPLNRYGKPSDITDAVVFLATKAGYVTGQLFVVDGGRAIP